MGRTTRPKTEKLDMETNRQKAGFSCSQFRR